jgi:hypothetical protein
VEIKTPYYPHTFHFLGAHGTLCFYFKTLGLNMFRFIPHPTQTEKPLSQWAAFISAKTKPEMVALATKSDFFYTDYSDKSDEYNFEYLSLLEIAAQEGALFHVTIYLETMNPSEDDVLKSFFRALEAQHTDVALLLLNYKKTSALVVTKNLMHNDAFATEDLYDYLSIITKSNHYNFRYTPKAAKGNVALIISAGLADPTLFYTLLGYPEIRAQLIDSGLAAFLSATLHTNGASKEAINLEIAFKLLDIPVVYEYADTRPFDFGSLVEKFDKKTMNTKDSISLVDSSLSLTSLSGMSSRTTPIPFFSRPPSVMGTLVSANSRATSVMHDPEDSDRPHTPYL